LIPLCIMAAVIGVRGCQTIRKSAAQSNRTYSRAYGMYAVMMTCSGLSHCVVPSSTNLVFNFLVTFLDLALTSSIAFHFGLAALADLGLDEDGKMMRLLVTLGETGIFGAWLWYGYLHPTGYAFWYLYVGVIVVCCGAYVLTQAFLLLRNRFRGLCWIALGVTAGGVGLWCALNRGSLCARFGANFGSSFWWDALSNIAMTALVGYYLASRDIPAPVPATDEEEMREFTLPEEAQDAPPAYAAAVSAAAHPQVIYMPLPMYPSPQQ